MITSNGRAQILQYIGGQASQLAGSVAFGVGATAPTVSDVRLQYEALRSPVTSIAADLSNNRLVVRTTIQPGSMSTIYEVGIYSATGVTSDTYVLPVLGKLPALWTNGTLTSTNARANTNALKVDFVASGTTNAELSGFRSDLSNFTDLDYFVTGFYATTNLSSAKIRLGSDASNYFEFSLTSPVVGYNIYRLARSTATKTGTPNWSAISYVAVRPSATAGGSGSLYFDGARFEVNSLNTSNVLIARAVLGTPQVVDPDVPTDFEYSLAVNIT